MTQGILDYLWWDPPIKSGDDTALGNSRIFFIASEAKQSLEILDFVLEILDFA